MSFAWKKPWSRRRVETAAVITDVEATVLSVDAPASLPLPFTAIPGAGLLIADAHARVDRLTAGGGADEFCGDVFDTHYDRWREEAVRSAAFLAGEQRRVDRVLVDDAHHRAALMRARADAAQRRARQLADAVDALGGTTVAPPKVGVDEHDAQHTPRPAH
jgi:hypothetical protein